MKKLNNLLLSACVNTMIPVSIIFGQEVCYEQLNWKAAQIDLN